MKKYPSISHYSEDVVGKSAIAFDKLDGSNMRFEWHRKKGWTKFGKRSDVINENEPILGEAIPAFQKKYAAQLEKIFRDDKELRNVQEFVAFAEWLGPNSAFGQHVHNDDMDVVLLDVSVYKKGIMPPRDFLRKFAHLGVPDVIFNGIIGPEFADSVRSSDFLKEGVVLKGVDNGKLWMAKLKTLGWMRNLKMRYGMEALIEDVGEKAAMLISDI